MPYDPDVSTPNFSAPTPANTGGPAGPYLSSLEQSYPGIGQLMQSNPAYASALSTFPSLIPSVLASSNSQIMGLTGQQNLVTGQSQSGREDLAAQLAGGLGRANLQNQDLGIKRGALDRQSALLPQLHDLYSQDLQTQLHGFQGNAAARGANVTVGYREGLGTYDRQFKRSDLNFNEQMAQLADQRKSLDITAKGIGISTTELQRRIDAAIKSLNLSEKVNSDDISRAITDVRMGTLQSLPPILQQVLNAALATNTSTPNDVRVG